MKISELLNRVSPPSSGSGGGGQPSNGPNSGGGGQNPNNNIFVETEEERRKRRRKEYDKAYRAENREKINAQQRIYRAEKKKLQESARTPISNPSTDSKK